MDLPTRPTLIDDLSALRARTRVAVATRAGQLRWQLPALIAVATLTSGWSLLPDVNKMFVEWAMELVKASQDMLVGAFDGSLGTLSRSEWSIATVMTGRMGAVMGVVAVGVAIVEVVASMVARDAGRLARAALFALMAWPVTASAAWAVIKVAGAADSLATAMIASSSAEELATKFFGPITAWASGTGTPSLVLVLFAVLVWLPTLMLSLIMAFRGFALLIGVAFAPVALMTMGWVKTRQMAGKWASMMAALLIAKPLAAGVVVLSVDLVQNTEDVGAVITGAVGLGLAAFAPAVAMRFFSFAGGHIAAEMGQASSSPARQASSKAMAPARKVGSAASGAAVNAGMGKAASFLKAGKSNKSAPSAGGDGGASGGNVVTAGTSGLGSSSAAGAAPANAATTGANSSPSSAGARSSRPTSAGSAPQQPAGTGSAPPSAGAPPVTAPAARAGQAARAMAATSAPVAPAVDPAPLAPGAQQGAAPGAPDGAGIGSSSPSRFAPAEAGSSGGGSLFASPRTAPAHSVGPVPAPTASQGSSAGARPTSAGSAPLAGLHGGTGAAGGAAPVPPPASVRDGVRVALEADEPSPHLPDPGSPLFGGSK